MNIQGKIVEIFDAAQVSDRFRKREFVIEHAENPQYPEFIKFELVQDKCDLIDDYKVGQEIDVYFNIKGRAWTNQQGVKNYFNSLQAWKIQAGGAGNAPAAEPRSAQPYKKVVANENPGFTSFSSDEEDGLPF